jgi:hypothetical protein
MVKGGGAGAGALVPPLGALVPPLDALGRLLTAPAPLLWYAPISGVLPRVFPMRSTAGASAARPAFMAGLRIPRDADQRSELMPITIPK